MIPDGIHIIFYLTSNKTVYVHFRSAKFLNAGATITIRTMQPHLLTAIDS